MEKIRLSANIIYVTDLPRAKAWYEKNFGMKTVEYRPPEFLEMTLGDQIFDIETENPKRPEGFREVQIGGASSAIFAVDDLKKTIEEMRAKGVKIVAEPVEPFWGGLVAKVADPDGNVFTIDQEVLVAVQPKTYISYEEFAQVEIKAGKIISAEKIPDTDKLLKLMVEFGLKPSSQEMGDDGSPKVNQPDIRQIVSGISTYFPDPSVLVGKKCMFVTNLEPRKIRGYESNGMLFALSTPEGAFSLLEPIGAIPPGTKAK